ncbi:MULTISPECIES: ArsR/SmtB family transcription factor [Streptomyces]
MTMRIHFTGNDLARTRPASGARPLMELEIAVRLLQERSHPVRFDAWRLRAATGLSRQMSPLFDLIPALGPSAGFLDMSGPESSADFTEKLRSTPARDIVRELEQWGTGVRRVPPSARRLGQDPSLIRQVADAVDSAHAHFVAPYWARMERFATADRSWRLQSLADHGIERLLRELNPRYITWTPPVLSLTTASGRDGDMHLAGRGLLLIPTVLGAHYPAFDYPDEGQPWITFPIRDGADSTLAPPSFTAGALADVPDSLQALLGRTRATVLCTLAQASGYTTTELAAKAHISLASASEHAGVLRNAGLTTVTRQGKQALHAVSPAGLNLLNSVASAL